MDDTLLGKIIHALVFLGICAAIIVIGWHEPLRYRFMSPEEIDVLENPPKVEVVTPDVGAWMRESKRKTMLDQPATGVQGGSRSQSMGR